MRVNVRQEIPAKFKTQIIPIQSEDNGFSDDFLDSLYQLTNIPKKALKESFSGKAKEVLPVWNNERCYLLVGIGKEPCFNKIQVVFRQLALKHSGFLGGKMVIDSRLWGDKTEKWVEGLINGLLQGTYKIGRYKSEQPAQHVLLEEGSDIILVTEKDHVVSVEETVKRGLIIGTAQKRIMDLVNAPSNYKTPQDLSKWAKSAAESSDFSIDIWGKERIKEAGMEALLAVNRGSEHPANFIVMEYKGKDPGHHPKVALVGKGVTFDTGGLSIKPSTNMHYMKSDMGGAAAVFGTVESVAKLKMPIHLIGVVPVTDNSVDALSIKPSDVIGSYSGKTIEVIDTDAEGRLILADGLSYAVREHKPHIVIDLATLTGSSVRTFGYQSAALFSNDDHLAKRLYEAGMSCGERVWRLPLWDEYGEEMKSDVADIKNFSGRPTSGAISAAKFLEFFTDNHPSWAHLDIAGVAFGDGDYGMGKTAKGYGVRLLVTFLESIMP